MSLKIACICLVMAALTAARVMPEVFPSENYPCPTMMASVCGSDGATYPNAICMANKDPTLTVQYAGKCNENDEIVPE